MKTFVAWTLGLALLAGAGFWGLQEYKQLNAHQSYRLALAKIRAEYEINTQGLGLLNEEGYQQNIGVALTRYFGKLHDLNTQFPGMQNFDRESQITDQRKDALKITDEQLRARTESFNITRKLFQQMNDGAYKPLLTASDHPFRLDILAIEPATIDGNPRIKVSFVQWGGGDHILNRNIVGHFHGAVDAKGKKQEFQMTAERQPPTMMVNPERWVEEFPPNARIGYYDLPLFPANASTLDLNFEFAMTTPSGTELPLKISFPHIALDASWKLTRGQWAQNQQTAAQ